MQTVLGPAANTYHFIKQAHRRILRGTDPKATIPFYMETADVPFTDPEAVLHDLGRPILVYKLKGGGTILMSKDEAAGQVSLYDKDPGF